MASLLHQQYPRSPDHVSSSERSICAPLDTGSLTAWALRSKIENGIDGLVGVGLHLEVAHFLRSPKKRLTPQNKHGRTLPNGFIDRALPFMIVQSGTKFGDLDRFWRSGLWFVFSCERLIQPYCSDPIATPFLACVA